MKTPHPVFAAVLLFVVVGCQRASSGSFAGENFVEVGAQVERVIGDDRTRFEVLTHDALVARGVSPAESEKESLIIGFPKKLIGEPLLFGGTIIKVSDEQNTSLGGLKLSQLGPSWVILRTDLDYEEKTKSYVTYLDIDKCESACESGSDFTERLARIRVLRRRDLGQTDYIYLDPTTLSQSMDLVQKLSDQFKTAVTTKALPSEMSSSTVQVDFSKETLALDILSKRTLPANSVLSRPEIQFSVTSRWYFKRSPTKPDFLRRAIRAGIGFFATTGGLIERFDLSAEAPAHRLKYFLKHVPLNRQAAFAKAFDNWNSTFAQLMGHPIFEYEFLDDSDLIAQKSAVAGDPRYNVVEWDLFNQAAYGGLGPGIADPVSGEVLSASVMVQGPAIEKLYGAWFEKTAGSPRNRVAPSDASESILPSTGRFAWKNPSESQALMDPLATNLEFFARPTDVSYDEYMNGYFTALLTHELGHNLGLRHNFKGSLGAKNGTVSRSIMDYLSGEYRHRNEIGEYDRMALAFGYLGAEPTHPDWYCTDTDETGPGRLGFSAECTSKDATDDPFGNFERLLAVNVRKLVVPENGKLNNFDDVAAEIEQVLNGLAAYAASAKAHSAEWLSFAQVGRPTEPGAISDFVVKRIVSATCSNDLRGSANHLGRREDRALADENLKSLEQTVRRVLEPFVGATDPSLQILKACRNEMGI